VSAETSICWNARRLPSAVEASSLALRSIPGKWFLVLLLLFTPAIEFRLQCIAALVIRGFGHRLGYGDRRGDLPCVCFLRRNGSESISSMSFPNNQRNKPFRRRSRPEKRPNAIFILRFSGQRIDTIALAHRIPFPSRRILNAPPFWSDYIGGNR